MQAATRTYPDAGDLLSMSLFNRLQDEIDANEQQKGLSPVDLLDLPDELATVIKKIVRQNGMKLADIAQELDQSTEETQEILHKLVEKGFVRKIKVKQETWYKARFARKRGRVLSSDFWSALDSAVTKEQTSEEDSDK